MTTTLVEWRRLQAQIALCDQCTARFPKLNVHCPPGDLYPSPPQPVKILFVGVAPPEKGRHFYTDPDDNLRRRLFAMLHDLQGPCQSIQDFLGYGFFLIHTAKCARRDTIKPALSVARFCAAQYLKEEIELLLPDSICWLSKNIGYPVAQQLSPAWSGQGSTRR